MGLDTTQLNINLIIQGMMLAIMIGMFYVVWKTTHAYGGIIGHSIRLLGFGILFISIAVIEKMLVNFAVIEDGPTVSMIQDVVNLVGLALLAWGFKKLATATKV
jgi:hypothetical protein